ncbi:unnamed protein product [Thelazia callipaeda]|uniref:Uncharacterized protein n=1 Tax=Thelazia callipaeda TaxID=103827 RepID=A0A0N5CLH4_THECL|nr:unnamed protein product [Thelazia callipaeda]
MENYKEENDVLLQVVEEDGDITQQESELDIQIDNLKSEIQELRKDQGEVQKLESNIRTLEEDLKQLEKFRDTLQEKLNANKKRKDGLEENIKQFCAEIADMKTTLAAKEKQLTTQSVSGEEARALRIRKDVITARIQQVKNERQEIGNENDILLSSNFKEASELRESYRIFVRAYEDISRTVIGEDPFIATLAHHSPNEPKFLEFIDEIEGKLNELYDNVNSCIRKVEDEITGTCRKKDEVVQRNSLLVENLKQIQRRTSKLTHDFNLKREDWKDEHKKLMSEVDMAQNELDSLLALRNGKVSFDMIVNISHSELFLAYRLLRTINAIDLHCYFQLSAHEELVEARKELQSRSIEIEEASKRTINEATMKFSMLLDVWEHLRVCLLLLFRL